MMSILLKYFKIDTNKSRGKEKRQNKHMQLYIYMHYKPIQAQICYHGKNKTDENKMPSGSIRIL